MYNLVGITHLYNICTFESKSNKTHYLTETLKKYRNGVSIFMQSTTK